MLLFRRCVPTTATIACICLTSTDHLRLIDFSSGAEGRSVKFELMGSPWSSWDWGLHARSLLLHLFSAAFRLGFQMVTSADVSSKYATDGDGNPDYPLDVHSIYLVKMPPQEKGVLDSLRQTVNDFSLPSYEEAMK